jgi:hypothetical protein
MRPRHAGLAAGRPGWGADEAPAGHHGEAPHGIPPARGPRGAAERAMRAAGGPVGGATGLPLGRQRARARNVAPDPHGSSVTVDRMPAKQRNPRELREQSKHVLYEVQMLFALGRYLQTGEVDDAVAGLDRDGLPVRNAVIEAFEIHARQLIEFLTHPRNGRRATARDWSTGWCVPQVETQELKQLRAAFSERVAHLSWKRSAFTAGEQRVIAHQIQDKLGPLLRQFLRRADPEMLCNGFVSEADAALSEGESDAFADPTALIEISPVAPNTWNTAGTATQPL